MAEYESMTREELIQELVLAKINEARAKKGYEVKGVGAEKEYTASASAWSMWTTPASGAF